MRWFTCFPLDVDGSCRFFARDCGLITKGLISNGIESKCVMPGNRQADDDSDLIRASIKELENPEWWKKWNITGVLLYSWGLPKFTRIAKAIKSAGIFLILNQDSNGLLFPMVMPLASIQLRWHIYTKRHGIFSALLLTPIWIFYRLTLGFLVLEPGRVHHLSLGDRIACVSPIAISRYTKYLNRLGRKEMVKNLVLLPHPVAPYFTHSPVIKKEERITAVGRWDDLAQKRTDLLCDTLTIVLSIDPSVSIDVIGKTSPLLERWHAGLHSDLKSRVSILGVIANKDLPPYYQRSSILFCCSSYESFHIAAAEALCCGCTIVAPKLDALPSFEWFTGTGHGLLEPKSDPQSLADSLLKELTHWRNGNRNPLDISNHWTEKLHSTSIAVRMIECYEQKHSS